MICAASMGSPVIAGWIAQFAFWALVAYGWVVGELTARRAAIFIGLWSLGLVGLPYVRYEPVHAMFSSLVAVLDIALVFTIFKGDVRLT